MQATDDVGWVPQWLINYSDSLALILSSIISNIFLLIMQIFPIFFFWPKIWPSSILGPWPKYLIFENRVTEVGKEKSIQDSKRRILIADQIWAARRL